MRSAVEFDNYLVDQFFDSCRRGFKANEFVTQILYETNPLMSIYVVLFIEHAFHFHTNRLSYLCGNFLAPFPLRFSFNFIFVFPAKVRELCAACA